PFENWSRGTPQMTGTVFWHLDHTAPLDRMRERLRDLLRECPAWDGRDYNLTVTETTQNTMQVRALVTAKDADDIWTVRVTVREGMIRWLAEEHPYALPRVNTADAAPRPSRDGVHRPRRSSDGGLRRFPEHPSKSL
ncbi:mechanosensitive ion channel family protein, partial [Streptomyces sp. NPDC057074]